VAVAIARFLRGPAKASEANAAMGNPLDSWTALVCIESIWLPRSTLHS
jgi:hypothetical protein